VDPCSQPAAVPPRATPSATTLLASVEPCSLPAAVPPRATSSATTLLASVEPCSQPAVVPCDVQHLEHRSTLASSVVANPPISLGTALVLNTAPRWQAAWWRWRGYGRDVLGHHAARQRGASFHYQPPRRPARPLRPPRCSPAWSHLQNQPTPPRATPSATTLLASVEPCSEPADPAPRGPFGHHAARQRGAMFTTSRPRAPRDVFGHHPANQRVPRLAANSRRNGAVRSASVATL